MGCLQYLISELASLTTQNMRIVGSSYTYVFFGIEVSNFVGLQMRKTGKDEQCITKLHIFEK